MRPEMVVPHSDPLSVLHAIDARLKAGELPCEGKVFRRHATLWISENARHFWSPHLYVEARIPGEEHCEVDEPLIHLRFAPHPQVWTFFMAVYALLGMVILGSLMFGFSQWWIGQSPWVLLIAPAAVALFCFVYGATFIGQGLGATQMIELRGVVDSACRRAD